MARPASASTSSTIWAGIPRHMARSSSLRLRPGRSLCRRRSAARAGGRGRGSRAASSRARGRVEQAQVLEAAAGEHDRPRLAGLGAGRAQRRPRPSRGSAAAISLARPSRGELRRDRPRRAPSASPKRHGYGSAGVVAGELLELDRRLALVADVLAHAEQRRDGVEEAAHARTRAAGSSFRLSRTSAQRGQRHRQAGALEVRGGDAPRLADRRLAAGQRHRLEVREPLEAGEVAAQQLAAPERPVGAVAGAVEDERERRARLAVLGEARRGVRVVVLDADELGVLLERPLRREVLGVEVVRDDARARRRASRGRARGRRGRRGRRARSRGRRGAARGTPRAPRATQNVLFSSAPAATSGRRGAGERQRRRARSRASGGAGSAARTTESSQRRWIGRSCARKASAIPPSRARASSSSKAIGSSERLPLVSTSGPPKSAASRWWSGVYGSISPSHGVPGATDAGDAARRAPAQSTIGRAGEREQLELVRARPRRARSGSARHHRERLLLAVLARAQPRDRVLVGRVAGEVVAAEALDRDDRARRAAARPPPRAAARAAARRRGSDRLGVEAAVGRILVLAAAVGAEREAGHRRVRAVVRDRADDREARAALGAVDERVAVAAVGRVEQLAQAVVAGGDVRRDQRRAAPSAGSRRSRSRARPRGAQRLGDDRRRRARAAAPRSRSAVGERVERAARRPRPRSRRRRRRSGRSRRARAACASP